MSVRNEDLLSRKRRRGSPQSLPTPSPEDSPALKRKKHTHKDEAYRWHRPPGYWDRLSKVHLGRAALAEYDRRTLNAKQPLLISPSGINTPRPATKSVKQFSRHGGPDLSHIRGLAIRTDQDIMNQPIPSRKRSASPSASGATSKTKTKTKSSYDPNFAQNLIDAGIYPLGEASEPNNFGDIIEDTSKRRDSLSPSRFGDEDFKAIRSRWWAVKDEKTVRAEAMSVIAGESGKQQNSAADRIFNHLKEFSKDLPQHQPDSYDGARPQLIDRSVRCDLGDKIVPSNNTSLPAAPNFFLEGKSASGRADVAQLQISYSGAVGTRAMHSLQNYKSAEPVYDGNAYCYSSTYHHGTTSLVLYAHHLTAPKAPGEAPEYHVTQLGGFYMTHNVDTFRMGASAFRNLRDRAKTDRDRFIDHANQIARGASATAPPTSTDSHASLPMLQEESETSADEVPAVQVVAKRMKYAPAEDSQQAATPPTSATTSISNEATIPPQPGTGAPPHVQSTPR
ncbi:hypothetical protein AYL99_09804 [Fonsecaea erecta]|uniref:Uncharacterized protein n=1 Tax=Fonsecaea erecta TaxID=1367422 RepID=A0A178Z7H4_9EURO|nr:hypothetical protein AYL99_09804 [Fonsecaea erecta]OAP55652.1 hypothetical protein AYL99_09804 [Fonsecaea erecta]